MNFFRTQFLKRIVFFTVLFLVLVMWNEGVNAQIGERQYATDPNAKGPPPDDRNEPDVGKRPRFLWELGRQRLPFTGTLQPLESLHNYDRWKDEPIPKERKQSLLRIATTVLLSDFHPSDLDAVRWHGSWDSIIVYDSNGEFVAREPGLKLSWLRAEWSIGSYTIRAGGGITIRLPKRSELVFRPRLMENAPEGAVDPETGEVDDLTWYNWQYMSKTGVRKVLSDFFEIPFDSDDDFDLKGYIENCAGVAVFTGKIGPPGTLAEFGTITAKEEDSPEWKTKPYPRRILITDSDPQYICVSFSFPKEE